MRRIVTKEVSAQSVVVPQGDDGYSVRPVLLVVNWASATPDDDVMTLTFKVKGQIVFSQKSTLLGSASGVMTCGVGLPFRHRTPVLFNPATGVVSTASEDGEAVTMPLPDCWWQGDVTIALQGANGSVVSNMLVSYEQSDKFPVLRE